MKNTIKLWLIAFVAIIALAFTGCDNGSGTGGTGGGGGGGGGGQTGPTHANVTIANVNFRTSGSFTQAQIDALRDEFNAIDNSVMAGFTGYVFRLTRSPSGALNITIDGAPGSQRATITASSGTILENLDEGKAKALEAHGYIGTWGGIEVRVDTGVDRSHGEAAFTSLKGQTEEDVIYVNQGRIKTVIITGPSGTLNMESFVSGILKGTMGGDGNIFGLLGEAWL